LSLDAERAQLSPATLARYTIVVNIPLAVAALMVIYHVPGVSPPTHLRLDGQVLAKIFSGHITRWDDPIINYEYAVVNTSQPSAARAQDLRAFLSWAITSGTALLGNMNFQPLPPSVVTLSEAQIAKIEG
jgi:ABC-type phosphate transport system substrate-binding protein